MFKLTVFFMLLVSLRSFAADQCVNLSGTYTLKDGDCDASTTSITGGVKLQQFVSGAGNELVLGPGYQVRIEQTDCQSFQLVLVGGGIDINDHNKPIDVTTTYSSDGLVKTLSSDASSLTYHEVYIRGLVNKDETMTLTQNATGIAVNYLGKLLTMAYVIPMTDTTVSKCQLTRVP